MDVYLIRHAEAVERDQFGHRPDEERPLTDAGRAQAERLAGEAAVEADELAPEGKCRKVAKRVNKQPAAVVGLLGHRPDLNELAAWLIGDKLAQIALDKGGVALIRLSDNELDKGAGELIWLLPAAWV